MPHTTQQPPHTTQHTYDAAELGAEDDDEPREEQKEAHANAECEDVLVLVLCGARRCVVWGVRHGSGRNMQAIRADERVHTSVCVCVSMRSSVCHAYACECMNHCLFSLPRFHCPFCLRAFSQQPKILHVPPAHATFEQWAHTQ